jgi:predicted Zn-dependent peptidase
VPANLVGAVVGDLELVELRPVLERTFGAVAAGPRPEPPRADEPPQRGEKRRVVRFAASPQLLMAFHKPTLPHADDYTFDVLDELLSGGRTSRLYRRLVLERKLASDVFTFGGPGSRLDNLFYVGAVPLPGVQVAALEREMSKVLAELGTSPPPEEELQRVRRQLETDQLRGLATNEGLASSLSYFQSVAGDWRYMARHGAEIAKVTAADVARVASTYLVPHNRTVVTLETEGGGR